MAIATVTDSSFEQDVLKSETPVLVDYWAEWCGPCRMIAPALEDLSKEFDGKVTIAKLNIDHNPQTPSKYGVRGMPTLMIFKDGKVAATHLGAMSKQAIADWINQSA